MNSNFERTQKMASTTNFPDTSPETDPEYLRYADMDFSDALPPSKVPALAAIQAQSGGGKQRITIRVDNRTLAAFKARAQAQGGSYQNLMNDALTRFVHADVLADVVRKTIQQELRQLNRRG